MERGLSVDEVQPAALRNIHTEHDGTIGDTSARKRIETDKRLHLCRLGLQRILLSAIYDYMCMERMVSSLSALVCVCAPSWFPWLEGVKPASLNMLVYHQGQA